MHIPVLWLVLQVLSSHPVCIPDRPTAGDGAEMDAIASVVVGGTSMSGGSGRIGGTLIGVLIIGVLNNGLNLMGVDSNFQYIVKGLVILLAVYVDFLRNKKAGR